ncbi:MAG: hypothetical protein QM751_12320 [Paludibacteraceae bacterium]
MKLSKSKAIALLVGLVVFVSVTTNLATNYFTRKTNSDYFAVSSNQLPEGYARFASATKALDTDFTVAADLTVHAVVHVKTKGTARQQQIDMFNDDPFFQYFWPATAWWKPSATKTGICPARLRLRCYYQ